MFLKIILLVLCFLTFSTVTFAQSQSIRITKFNDIDIDSTQWTYTSPKVLDANSIIIPYNVSNVQFAFNFTFIVSNVPDSCALLYGEWTNGIGELFSQVYSFNGQLCCPNGTYGWDSLTTKSNFNPFVVKPDLTFKQNTEIPAFHLKLVTNSGILYSDWYYFKVIPCIPEDVSVFNIEQGTASPLSFDANLNLYSLNFVWQIVQNPVYGASNSTASIVNSYKGYRDLTLNFGTTDNIGYGTGTFLGATSYDPKKKYSFTVFTKNNVPLFSENPSPPCYAFDSYKKSDNGFTTPVVNFFDSVNTPLGDVIFNGWFNVSEDSMYVDFISKNLFLERDTQLEFTNGHCEIISESVLWGDNVNFIVNGGELYFCNLNVVEIDDFASGVSVKNGFLIVNSDLTFNNGSVFSVYDALNVKTGKTIRIRNGSKLIVNENTIISCAVGASIIVESGGSVEIEGQMNISDLNALNITMQNGSFFKLANGAKLVGDLDFTTDKNFECGTNAEIIVNNNFTATNSVFTKSNSATKWRGFLVTNPTANLNLTNCSIQNAQIGIYGASDFNSINLNNCTINDNLFGVVARYNPSGSVEIKNCSIFDNNYGVYTDLNGYAEIDGSEIYNNQKGIYTTVRGFVTAKNTNIYNNTNYGATISNEANAFFGSELTGGQNRFFNNGTWDILNYENSLPTVVFAQNNFWLPSGQAGNCNTNGNNCFDENLAPVSGCSAVRIYPNADCNPNGNAVNSQEISNLLSAFESESDGDFALAEIKFLNFITTFPTSNYWSTALSGVVRNKKA